MIWKYMYSITGSGSVNEIKTKNKFDLNMLNEGIYQINSDILNEHFYYGLIDLNDNLCPTYQTGLKIDVKSNFYEINYKILSNDENSIGEILKIYTPEDFNLNEIIELSGCELEETYNTIGLEVFDIGAITLKVELFEFNEYFDDDYDHDYDCVKTKQIQQIESE